MFGRTLAPDFGDALGNDRVLPAVGRQEIQRRPPRDQGLGETTVLAVLFCLGGELLELIAMTEPATGRAGNERRGDFRPARRTSDCDR